MNKICVLGSMNLDLVLSVNSLPKKGETLMVESLQKNTGGKGANQAVACKRLGSSVSMISRIGSDDNGKILLSALNKENIDTTNVSIDSTHPTGIAIITVDSNGDNTISVVAGANMNITHQELSSAKSKISDCNVLISQFETPYDLTIEAFQYAKEIGKITVLNPAPARTVTPELLNVTDIIVPNETEAFELTGIKVTDLESACEAGKQFISMGVKFAVITLGEKGAALISSDRAHLIPAFKVSAVDTTAAGDSFIGAVSSKLENSSHLNFEKLKEAVKFGNKVSSITVTREGAQASLPYIDEIDYKNGG